MKKVIYIIIITFVASLSITACTEEKIEPSVTLDNGGGSGSERTNP